MRLFKDSLLEFILFVAFIILLAVGVCNAANYVLLAPPGMSTFIDRTGTPWTPDANNMVTVTDPSLIQGFINAGFTLLRQSASTVTHNYGDASTGAALTWTLSAEENAAAFLVATNAGAAVSANPLPYLGQIYLVYNNSGYALTVKAVGQTGVVIPNGATTIVMGNGTDFTWAPNTLASVALVDQTNCTMTSGACSAVTLGHTYAVAPLCFATWNGTGTCTGILKAPSTTTTVTPASSVGTDTCHVNVVCFGN